MKTQEKILILSGANGVYNLGDDAMFEVVASLLKRNNVYIYTDGKKGWTTPFADQVLPFLHKGVHNKMLDRFIHETRLLFLKIVLRLPSFLYFLIPDPWINRYIQVIKDIDLIVYAGMGAMNDTFVGHGIYGRAMIAAVAQRFHKRIIVVGNGIGPIDHKRNQEIVRSFLPQIEKFFVRDKLKSAKILEALGYDKKNIVEYIDDAFFLQFTEEDEIFVADLLKKLQIKKQYMVINIHNWDKQKMHGLFESMAKVLESFKEYQILLVPNYFSEKMDDRFILENFRKFLEKKGFTNIVFLKQQISASHVKLILKYSKISIATRYHIGVFSLSVGTPTVLLCLDDNYYVQKMRGILDWYNLDEFAIKFTEKDKLRKKLTTLINDRKTRDLILKCNNRFNIRGYLAGNYLIKKIK